MLLKKKNERGQTASLKKGREVKIEETRLKKINNPS